MAPRSPAPLGQITRGTTGTNRLRRVDRWIARRAQLRRADDPYVVDLGFGARAVTTFELHERLRRARPDVAVHGIEISPERVARARAYLADVRAHETSFAPDALVSFGHGGFDVPTPRGHRPIIVRAMNVLRQYDEHEVADAWSRMAERLAPGGLLVEGTCDEIGRVSTWVAVDADGAAQSLTVSLRLTDLEAPSIAAERLPKALIHHNVPGEPIHTFLRALDDAWNRNAALASFGSVQRWRACLASLMREGWPLLERSRGRLGEVTVPWHAVAPDG